MTMSYTETYPEGNKVVAGKIHTAIVPLTAGTYYQGMPLRYSAACAVVANALNTGNGAVTNAIANKTVKPGAYTLICIDDKSSDSLVVGTVTPGAGNTGGGTVTNFALSVIGTPKQGTYRLECVSTSTNGGNFRLSDPDNVVVMNAIVLPGTPGGYVDYEGGGITFRITDGTPDFSAGDYFLLTVIGSHGGTFKLVSSSGEIITENIVLPGTPGGSVNFVGGGFTFTLTEDSIDFVENDSFELTVPTNGSYSYTTDYTSLSGIYNGVDGRVITGTGYGTIIMGGEICEAGIVDDAGAAISVTDNIMAAFAANGFYIKQM
jgi:hypothetical protein